MPNWRNIRYTDDGGMIAREDHTGREVKLPKHLVNYLQQVFDDYCNIGCQMMEFENLNTKDNNNARL